MMRIDEAIARLAIAGGRRGLAETARTFLIGCVAKMRRAPEEAAEMADGMGEIAGFTEAASGRWVDTIARGGEFDACDLRPWLEMAERAGVPYVPARTILSLDEGELEHLAGGMQIPSYLERALTRLVKSTFGWTQPENEEGAEHDSEALEERLREAMDDVPEGWIVRSHICGPNLLKAWAGSGTLAQDTTLRAGQGLEVGPGWVRVGNRRRVDATDSRYVTLFPQGHGKTIHYMARPWAAASRRTECEDPHRHGTIFAGKGSWPCEWRVFVERGKVTGVAFYYGWAGEATPTNARKALEAKTAAEKIIEAGRSAGMTPRMMDIEILKLHAERGRTLPERCREALERFGEGFAGTLDFLETDQGMTLLEGGPGHTPIGGGHPCAFAGAGEGMASEIEGVALKLMDHVIPGRAGDMARRRAPRRDPHMGGGAGAGILGRAPRRGRPGGRKNAGEAEQCKGGDRSRVKKSRRTRTSRHRWPTGVTACRAYASPTGAKQGTETPSGGRSSGSCTRTRRSSASRTGTSTSTGASFPRT